MVHALKNSIFLLLALVAVPQFSFAKKFATKDEDPAFYRTLDSALKIPLYFAIPKTASARNVPDEYDTPDKLFYYEHPGSPPHSANPVGLRFYIADRSPQVAQNLAASKFVKSGDVIVSFRSDWAHSGPYTQAQMGQTHAGLIYVTEEGTLENIEHPLEGKFLFKDHIIGADPLDYLQQPNLDRASIYKNQPMVHIFRPRFMDERRTRNFNAWARLLRALTSANPTITGHPELSIFPKFVGFNINYMAPKVKRGETAYEWVKQFGQLILQKPGTPRLDMFCSELVYSFLSLSNCDPVADRDQILADADTPAACISPAFKPLPMIGDFFAGTGEDARPIEEREAGLSDGPPLVVEAIKPSNAARQQILNSVFNPATGASVLSAGQQQIVRQVTPAFLSVAKYYKGINLDPTNKYSLSDEALAYRDRFNMQTEENGFLQPDPHNANDDTPVLKIHFVDNYSPTSFGINSYLPDNNKNRRFDYVGTIAFTDIIQAQRNRNAMARHPMRKRR